ncbi:MAG: glycosyltransferase [Saprospiraceae bacterium]|nr:glycosyltransferase [Saprospiraceae bacterium]
MKYLARSNPGVNNEYTPDYTPKVSIITAVYNEESILKEKFDCLEKLEFPRKNLHIFFGSDKSTDRSNEMLRAFEKKNDHVTFIPFNERRGKIGVINSLGEMAIERFGQSEDHIFLYNDANVMIPPDLVKRIAANFSDGKLALVDANMMSRNLSKMGISRAERAYINREVLLKHWEGQVWGTLQGAFGGCYGLRSTFFIKVPPNYLVDDFYISFNAMLNGGWAVNDLNAKCYESASHDIWQEFKRKSRISAGNYQNLSFIFGMWNKARLPLKFCFLSHKVIRWVGPFLMLFSVLSLIFLWIEGESFYGALFWISLIGAIVIPLLDIIMSRLGRHVDILRKIRYFIMMNIALLTGFFKYVKGIQNSFWEPPKRV